MESNTNRNATVSIEPSARLLREALTACRRNVSCPIRDDAERELLKRIDNERVKPCEQIVGAQYSAFKRGALRADLLAFWRAGVAMIESWYGDDVGDLPQLIRLETQAQAVADLGEIDMALEPSGKTIADAAELLRGHLVALDRLVSACERRQFAEVRNQRVA